MSVAKRTKIDVEAKVSPPRRGSPLPHGLSDNSTLPCSKSSSHVHVVYSCALSQAVDILSRTWRPLKTPRHGLKSLGAAHEELPRDNSTVATGAVRCTTLYPQQFRNIPTFIVTRIVLSRAAVLADVGAYMCALRWPFVGQSA